MPRRLKVAFVAPSLRILGGQAVQADRLLRPGRNDPDVDAWLVPVNPLPPKLLRWTLRVKYLRTVVTELTYLPLLVRQLARADVVHVFSASYASFLLAPLPAMLVARALGRPVVLNYRSGEAPDHLQRSAIARKTIARVDLNVVPSRFLVDVFRGFGIDATIVPNIVDLDTSRIASAIRSARASSRRGISSAVQRGDDDPGVPARAGSVAGRHADARRRRPAGNGASRADRAAAASERDVRRPRAARRDRGLLRGQRHLRSEPEHRQHADVGARGVRERAAGRVHRSRRRAGDPDAWRTRAARTGSRTTRRSATTCCACSTTPITPASSRAARTRPTHACTWPPVRDQWLQGVPRCPDGGNARHHRRHREHREPARYREDARSMSVMETSR